MQPHGRSFSRDVTHVFTRVVAALGACALVLVSSAAAQQSSPAGTPASAPAKNWVAPRTPDGQPDLQGFWAVDPKGPNPTNIQTGLEATEQALSQGVSREKLAGRKPVSSIIDPADGKIPFQPWAQKRYDEILSRYNGENVTGKPQSIRDVSSQILCIYGPRMVYFMPFQVVQAPGYVILSWEEAHEYRVIPLDQAAPAPANVKLYKGDSRGRWDGNTLVVNVTNLNDWTWFDSKATLHTDATTMVERFTFVDADTIRFTQTVTDPNIYTQPWTMAWTLKRTHAASEKYEQLEFACSEGEKAFEHLFGDMYPNQRP